MSKIEERLYEKAKGALRELRGLREPKVEDIFKKRYYIGPEDLAIKDYKKSKPLVAFNPGALIQDKELLIFPRLIFDYYSYCSSVGVFSVDVEKAINGQFGLPLETRIILYPDKPWELFKGCEDPRVSLVDDRIYILYTAAGTKSILGFCELSGSYEMKRKGYFVTKGDSEELILGNKDSTFVKIEGNKAAMLTRPAIGNIALCWRAEVDLETLTIDERSLTPVLAFEEWEEKVGWSTNTVKLSAEEYLVGWHGVLKEDGSYKNGLAIVDSQGELKALSNYLLAPQGLIESYGDRPLVIFGDGLVRYNDYLIWVGGISDYGIGIFITTLSKAWEKLIRC